jgi:lipoprotein-anchoring transpeptidase ErfK/SrfK
MGRERSQLSRALAGILTIVVAIGVVAYFHETTKSKAADKPKVSSALLTPAPAPVVEISPPKPTTPAPMVSSAPKTEVSLSSAKPGPSGPGSASPMSPSTRPSTQPTAMTRTKASPITLSGKPLIDGKTKMDAGDLLAARRILNAALVSGSLSEPDALAAKTMLNTINQTLVFSPKHFADDEYGGTYTVQPGELLTKIAAAHDVTWQYLCRANGLSDPKRLRANATIKVIKGPFYAQVEKHKFNMEIWVGGEPYSADACYVTSFPVGLGRDDSTPTGKWMIQPGNKIKNPTYYSPRGEGVIEAGDPKNPLGQYWLGLVGVDGHAVGKLSYGIHGTIDPDSIGKQESMGCIRMRNEDVALVFEMLVSGKSTVVVKD